jgi:hypothetical protein
MNDEQQVNMGGASSEASPSASLGTHWAHEKYFTALRPATPKEIPTPLYDIDAIAEKLNVEDTDDLGDDGKPLVIKIKG